jgi:hypothetical protein
LKYLPSHLVHFALVVQVLSPPTPVSSVICFAGVDVELARLEAYRRSVNEVYVSIVHRLSLLLT